MFHLAVLNALRTSMLINAQNPLRLPVPFLAFVGMLTAAWIASTVDLSFLSEEFFALDRAKTSVLSLKRPHVWKQATHNVLESIGIVQARGLSSCHRFPGDYFEGETPWVLLDLTDPFFPALKSAFLYASPRSCFCPFPCLVQQRIAL